jgi:hypothetical protein
MKRLIILALLLAAGTTLEAQTLSHKQQEQHDRLDGYYLVIGKDVIQIDGANMNFNPKWIRKTVIRKEKEERYIREKTTGGEIYFYTKKRYKKKILEYIKTIDRRH